MNAPWNVFGECGVKESTCAFSIQIKSDFGMEKHQMHLLCILFDRRWDSYVTYLKYCDSTLTNFVFYSTCHSYLSIWNIMFELGSNYQRYKRKYSSLLGTIITSQTLRLNLLQFYQQDRSHWNYLSSNLYVYRFSVYIASTVNLR